MYIHSKTLRGARISSIYFALEILFVFHIKYSILKTKKFIKTYPEKKPLISGLQIFLHDINLGKKKLIFI